MSAILPSSRLLPITVIVASLVAGMKVIALTTTISASAGLRAEGAHILTSAAETRITLANANAAPSKTGHGTVVQQAPILHSPIPAVPFGLPTLPLPVIIPSDMPGQAPPVHVLSVQGVSLQNTDPPVASLPVLGIATAALSPEGAAVQPLPVQPSEAVQATNPPVATPDALKVRRSLVEEREQKLVEREATIAAADKHLSERIGELTALQARLQALESGLKERDEANWAGMVKTYEGMRPKDAASIFNALEKSVLLELLDRMKPAKATPVIAAMDPEKARQATADLAAKRTHSTTVAN